MKKKKLKIKESKIIYGELLAALLKKELQFARVFWPSRIDKNDLIHSFRNPSNKDKLGKKTSFIEHHFLKCTIIMSLNSKYSLIL